MENWGFVAVVVVGALVATRLLGRSQRNQGSDHGGGLSSSVDTAPPD